MVNQSINETSINLCKFLTLKFVNIDIYKYTHSTYTRYVCMIIYMYMYEKE